MKLLNLAFAIVLTQLLATTVKGADLLPANATNTAITNAAITNATNDVEAAPPGSAFTNSVGMVLLQVPGGFWAGKYEVTQKEFQKVLATNPSQFTGDNYPVDSVTYDQALEFCDKLTARDLKEKALPTGYRYNLPTEAEWMGLVGDASEANAVTSLNNAPKGQTSPVGTLAPNNLGLYDVLGNVMEFCLGDDSKPYRFLKGGSWQDSVAINLRPQFRWYCKPDEHLGAFGFRCVLKKD